MYNFQWFLCNLNYKKNGADKPAGLLIKCSYSKYSFLIDKTKKPSIIIDERSRKVKVKKNKIERG